METRILETINRSRLCQSRYTMLKMATSNHETPWNALLVSFSFTSTAASVLKLSTSLLDCWQRNLETSEIVSIYNNLFSYNFIMYHRHPKSDVRNDLLRNQSTDYNPSN